MEGGTADSSTPSPAVIPACQRCRKQKLRCSRDLPTCKRCRNIAAICEYPQPPDRRRLAIRRVQKNAEARAQRESDVSHQARSASRPEDYRASTPPLNASLTRTTLPSPEVAIFLIEIFFSRMYNANLLFHKPTLLSDFHANKVPDFVALSIYALASIFLGTSQDHARQDSDEDGVDLGISMIPTSDSCNRGFEWATAASQRVLLQADVPRLETIQACQNLALYWFSRGQTHRTHIHAVTAYRTARLLNLQTLYSQVGDSESSDLLDERRRRCFWACWITHCVSQDNADFKTTPWQEVLQLPLPSDEASFCSGTPISSEYFDANGEIVSLHPLSFKPSASPMGEQVKLFNLWWEIQHFVKHKAFNPADSSSRVTTFWELDRRLGIFFENLHPDFRYQQAGSFASPRLDPYQVFSIHILYRVCACALHTSIVPLFSETPSTPLVSTKLKRISVEESVKHASVMLDMASVFLNTRPDISRLPSITGYAMFVACAVHFKSLVAQRRLQQQGTSRFKGAVCILERLKEYWATNQGLWVALKDLFATKGVDIGTISESNDRVNTNSDERDTDLDKIVSHKGTPEGNQGTDIYTYVALDEAKAPSPRPSSNSGSNPRASSTKNTPPAASIVASETVERAHPVQQTTNHPELLNTNPEARMFAVPHQPLNQNPSPQSLSPFTQGTSAYAPSFTSSPQDTRQSFNTTATGFVPIGAVAEVYQMQGNATGMGHVPLDTRLGEGQSMGGFGEMLGYLDTGMDVDGGDIWWDQSFDAAFEADPSQMNPLPDGSATYNYEAYSFN